MTAYKPQRITFTGVDVKTDLDEMTELSEKYPIEWGVLQNLKQEGTGNRYPDLETVLRVVEHHEHYGFPLAYHACGEAARSFSLKGQLPDSMVLRFSRVQVNLPSWEYNFNDVMTWADKWTIPEIICQFRGLKFPDTIHSRVTYLQDGSGGRGIYPDYWAKPAFKHQYVGYAGGLNPDNILQAIEDIDATNYWLDMETGVRTDDWLDLGKCRAVCKAVWGQGD